MNTSHFLYISTGFKQAGITRILKTTWEQKTIQSPYTPCTFEIVAQRAYEMRTHYELFFFFVGVLVNSLQALQLCSALSNSTPPDQHRCSQGSCHSARISCAKPTPPLVHLVTALHSQLCTSSINETCYRFGKTSSFGVKRCSLNYLLTDLR